MIAVIARLLALRFLIRHSWWVLLAMGLVVAAVWFSDSWWAVPLRSGLRLLARSFMT